MYPSQKTALGNWSGKQRRDERQGKLNPLKKSVLEQIGFTFDPKAQKWEAFHKKLKAYLAKHGTLPANIDNNKEFLEEVGVEWLRKLRRFYQEPRKILGEYKVSHHKDENGVGIKKEWQNFQFTQERIDVLTKAGYQWNLNTDQVNALKEKGLIFPSPSERPLPANGSTVELEKHTWLTMFEALVEFKKQNGHTVVTSSNASEELHHWVEMQRKNMIKYDKHKYDTKHGRSVETRFTEHQVEMLSGIGFIYSKADVGWMENYERLVGKDILLF